MPRCMPATKAVTRRRTHPYPARCRSHHGRPARPRSNCTSPVSSNSRAISPVTSSTGWPGPSSWSTADPAGHGAVTSLVVADDWRAPSTELANLVAGLRFHSLLLLEKTNGLDDADLARALVPSGTSLIGLVEHMMSVHDYYFVECILQRPSELQRVGAGPDHGTLLFEQYRAVVERSCEILGDIDDLGRLVPSGNFAGRFNIRATVLHVIAEATRHNGHADIIRELIDGATGFRIDPTCTTDPRNGR